MLFFFSTNESKQAMRCVRHRNGVRAKKANYCNLLLVIEDFDSKSLLSLVSLSRDRLGDTSGKFALNGNICERRRRSDGDSTGTHRKSFQMIISAIVSICRRLIGDISPIYRSRSPTVAIIWKQGFREQKALVMQGVSIKTPGV